jgi:hypothetical protein
VTEPKARSYIKVDRYAGFQLRREYGLRSDALLVLWAVTFLADFRDKTWRGTITDLSEDLGIGRRSAKEALEKLANAGLLHIEEPFTGRGQTGLIRVLVYEILVVVPRTARDPARSADDPAHLQRAVSALSARDPAHSSREISPSEGNMARRDGGASPLDQDRCLRCDGPIAGHPYDDHEPVRSESIETSPPASTEDPSPTDNLLHAAVPDTALDEIERVLVGMSVDDEWEEKLR